MVAVRRSSTRLATPATPATVKEVKDEDKGEAKEEIVLKDTPPARKKQKRKSAGDDDAPSTSKKKATPKTVAKRGNVGKLARLNTIPTDVFLVIAGFLHPLDLLHVSRTNKAWRELLLSSNSKQIWRAARSTLPGLPDCPSDLLEIQYAKLLFEHDCYRCGTRNVPKADFCLRIRLCNPCARKEVFAKKRFKHTFPKGDADILKLIPYTNTGAFSHGHASTSEFYHTPAVEKMQILLVEQEAELDQAEFQEWLDLQVATATKIRETGEEMAAWFSQEAILKYRERIQTGEQRKEEIFSRLQAAGHDPQDIKLNWGLKCYDAVIKPQQLTERMWQNLLPKLEEAVQKNKQLRLERETQSRARSRLDVLKSFYNEVCDGTVRVRPSAMDFYNLPSMIPVWQPDQHRILTRADFPDVALVRQEVDQFVAQIKYGLERRLAAATVEEYPGVEERSRIRERVRALRFGPQANEVQAPSISDSPVVASTSSDVPCPDLALATSVFACGQCLEPLSWPSLLRHSHIEGTHGYTPQHAPDAATGPIGEWTKRWDPKSVTVSKAAILVMHGVLKALSYPETTAFNTLENYHQRICCNECFNNKSTWKFMFTHYLVQTREESAKAMSSGTTTASTTYVLPAVHCPVGKEMLFRREEMKNKYMPSSQATGPATAPAVALTPLQMRAKTQKILRCRLCRDARLFMYSSITSHIRDKHHIYGRDQEQHIIWP